MEMLRVSAHSIGVSTSAEGEKGGMPDRNRDEFESGSGSGLPDEIAEYSSESSSSIGTPGESEDEDENEVSSDRSLGFCSLTSLEDSLSIKSGLSNHYRGKSKSFADLSDVSSVKDVEKTENPLNKKRRMQISSKLRGSSFYSWRNPKSMPLLPVQEDDDDDDEGDRGAGQGHCADPRPSLCSSSEDEDGDKQKFRQRKSFNKTATFKSRSCFCLADLQEEED